MRDHETRVGGCLCGAIRYQVRGAPRRITNCHCLHCRRSSGAAFVTWMEFHPEDFEITTGKPSRHLSRPQVSRRFCGSCGTQLTYEHADEPETIDVTVCSLDSIEGLSPEDHVWADRMVPWLEVADGLPRYRRGKFDER